MELIKIQEKAGENIVSAKDLHNFLEVKTALVIWCKRMFEYGFEDGIDYVVIKSENPVNKQVTVLDYALSIDCAKEISMIQRTDKGKQARTYFIDVEKQSKLNRLPSKKELALMVVEAEEKAERLQLEIQTKHIPRSQFVDQVFNSDALITMSQAAKSLGLGFGRNTLFKKLREKGVLFKSSNEPKQQYIDSGYFKIKEKIFPTPTGDKIKLQTYVTQKGLGYIAKIFKVVQLPVTNQNKSKFISA